MTQEDYCSFEVAKLLKEKGFNWGCFGKYSVRSKEFHLDCRRMCNNGGFFECAAPTHQMAMKWLREEKRICVEVDCCASGYTWELCKAYQGDWFSGGTTIYTHYCEDNYNNALLNDCGKYESYEDALLEGIKEAVRILKEK